jgi:hypothetical protein
MTDIMAYEYEKQHLTEAEVLERYVREKALYPDSTVVLEDFDCGHWQVIVYKTETEKMVLFQKKLDEIMSRFLSHLVRLTDE